MDPDEFSTNPSVMAIMPSGPSNMQINPTILRAPEHHYNMASLQDISGGDYSTILPVPSTVPHDRSTAGKGPDKEEMEEAEEGSEWAVRVGDAPPPAWSKRKASDDDERNLNKRARFHRGSTPTSRIAGIHAMVDPTTELHVIDQGIHQIARDFRFTVEEVQEYYDKCGEMALTEKRFKRMREELQTRFQDEVD